ncbi:hypothetical protein RIF29_41782 [Crotalaria pallida]|uniref:Uncharacterized protein n=1 Tax=Crotalaria pallida TaxID=3830 RepID=A0AAN9E717_CROPI
MAPNLKMTRFCFPLLFLLLTIFFIRNSYAELEGEHQVLHKVRTAPHKNVGTNVIDGTGVEKSVKFEVAGSNVRKGSGSSSSRVLVSTVALFTLAMAAATGLGAVPFFFVELDPQWAGLCNGMAAGVMLAASFDLIQEGQEYGSGSWVVIGILAGGIFIWLCKKIFFFMNKLLIDRALVVKCKIGEVSMLDLKGADATKVALVIGIMTLHSFGGRIWGWSLLCWLKGFHSRPAGNFGYCGTQHTRGIGCEHGVGFKGCLPTECYVMERNHIFTSESQLLSLVKLLVPWRQVPIVAVPSFICADAFSKFLPFCTGFAAGCMIWMVIAEVLPDAFKNHVFRDIILVSLSFGVQEAGCISSSEDASGFFVSLLFGLGLLLGGIILVAFALAFHLQHAFLIGIACGTAFVLGAWRPLQLILSSKLGLIPVSLLLAMGDWVLLSSMFRPLV